LGDDLAGRKHANEFGKQWLRWYSRQNCRQANYWRMESCSFYYRFLIKPALANLSMVSGLTWLFGASLCMYVPSPSNWLLGQQRLISFFLFFFFGACSEWSCWEASIFWYSCEHGSLLGLWNASVTSKCCNSCDWLDWSCLCPHSLRSVLCWCLPGPIQDHHCFLLHLYRSKKSGFPLSFSFHMAVTRGSVELFFKIFFI